jgi:hypothetical protein
MGVHLLDPLDDADVQEWQEFLRRPDARPGRRWLRVTVAAAVLLVAGVFAVLLTSTDSYSAAGGDAPPGTMGGAPGAHPLPGYPVH